MEKDSKGEKRKRFHQALLNFYHPPSPPRSPPPPSPQLTKEELVAMVCGDMALDLDQGDEYDDGSELGCTSDVESKKLTRAQRKRIRKRKLKEAASVRRKIIGPLLPSSDQDLNKPSKKPSHENLPESRQDSAEHLSC
ncbi:uncharacterized protein LOC103979796 [Musa acuminata AAA Group]|uniref:uncharacterized protein LOC103979796 n=1 Tax=Musa acuminata AAA Group TaxID=214697 RepID=UPI0031CE9B30